MLSENKVPHTSTHLFPCPCGSLDLLRRACGNGMFRHSLLRMPIYNHGCWTIAPSCVAPPKLGGRYEKDSWYSTGIFQAWHRTSPPSVPTVDRNLLHPSYINHIYFLNGLKPQLSTVIVVPCSRLTIPFSYTNALFGKLASFWKLAPFWKTSPF